MLLQQAKLQPSFFAGHFSPKNKALRNKWLTFDSLLLDTALREYSPKGEYFKTTTLDDTTTFKGEILKLLLSDPVFLAEPLSIDHLPQVLSLPPNIVPPLSSIS